MSSRARLIAFYLPQFHPTKENDAWWGKGFTEWTNVTKAQPLFHGHHQPNLPADLGFYDLRLPEVRQAQADLAKQYGVAGFCYYHYWFGDGRRMLERPFNEVLASGKPDFPFCLCWANHSWNTIWQGTDDCLLEQRYPGMEDHAAHFDWLLHAFKDPRHLTVDGKPIFVIYKPDDVPDLRSVTEYWRARAIRAGLPGLWLVGMSHFDPHWSPRPLGLDASIMQALPPRDGHLSWRYPIAKLRQALGGRQNRLTVLDYRQVLPMLLRRNDVDWPDYPVVLPNWDNTPRSGRRGLVLHGSTPALFQEHLREAIGRVSNRAADQRLVFLKAWNEWAEGNYVEPDRRFGHAYLETIRQELLIPTLPPSPIPGISTPSHSDSTAHRVVRTEELCVRYENSSI